MGDSTQSRETIEALARLDERMKFMEANLAIAHTRIDKMQELVGKGLDEIREDLKPLRDWMNRGRGGLAVMVMAGSIIGGLVATFTTMWVKR